MSDNPLQDKVVLVTGGAGSIGSALVEEALQHGAKVVRALDHNEYAVFSLGERLGNDPRLRLLLGDVRDRERMARATRGVDVVYHAAALKHVPLCEYNPFEAMQTNVVGTQNCIDAALAAGVDRFILVSTDKAVLPANTMGASKLLAERLVVDAHKAAGDPTRLACVRFGNVLGSRGSVVETFMAQAQRGQPFTITDPKMTRFAMRIRDATALIRKATALMQGGETMILRMDALKVPELARAVALQCGQSPSKVRFQTVGRRPGEKLHELLMTEEEAAGAVSTPELHIVLPADASPQAYRGARKAKPAGYSSASGPFLTARKIAALLKE